MDDISRLQAEYENRKVRLEGSNIYSRFNLTYLFLLQQRQRAVLKELKRYGFEDLSDAMVLEMGCGAGGVLVECVENGVSPKNLFGVDLIFERLLHARLVLPGSGIINADGQVLPFPRGSFDLVFQFTALSSILDPMIRQKICSEMLRVLKSDGIILSYDFWLNPLNKQTSGIKPVEIKRLFPNCSYKFHKITLAPPLTRMIVPISWITALLLEKLSILNTHFLTVIKPLMDRP